MEGRYEMTNAGENSSSSSVSEGGSSSSAGNANPDPDDNEPKQTNREKNQNNEARRKPGSLGKRKGTDSLRRENKVVRDAANAAGLNKDQRRRLHDKISGRV
jgi:hypothetical protein